MIPVSKIPIGLLQDAFDNLDDDSKIEVDLCEVDFSEYDFQADNALFMLDAMNDLTQQATVKNLIWTNPCPPT